MQAIVSAHAGPRFGTGQPQPALSPADRLKQYHAAWLDLLAWDRRVHGAPVIQQVNMPRLLASADTFLKRQAQADPSRPMPYVIGVTGSPASGKTTIKNHWLPQFQALANRLLGWKKSKHGPVVQDIELDHYYKDFSAERKALGDDAFFRQTDLDAPNAVSLEQAQKDLLRLKNGRAVRMQHYQFSDCSIRRGQELKSPTPFLLVEGMFAFVPQPLWDLMDMRIFFNVNDQTIHDRWWKRAPERKLEKNEAGLAMFNRAMSGYRQHVELTRTHADVIINSAAPLKDINDTMRRLTRILLQAFYPVQH